MIIILLQKENNQRARETGKNYVCKMLMSLELLLTSVSSMLLIGHPMANRKARYSRSRESVCKEEWRRLLKLRSEILRGI